MNELIKSIYATGKVVGKNGTEIPLHSEVDPAEGAFIHRIISQDPGISKTLEVGCAYGLSSLHICDALKSRANPQHIILDPFQNSRWDGAGIRNLEQAGITFFKFIEKRSEFALPELLALGEGTLDFIFIDGWHTFDHTLLDCFYATRLLKVGGYLLIDDVCMDPVGRAVEYVSRYPCYRLFDRLGEPHPSLGSRAAKAVSSLLALSGKKQPADAAVGDKAYETKNAGIIAFKKIAKDERPWDWYPEGF